MTRKRFIVLALHQGMGSRCLWGGVIAFAVVWLALPVAPAQANGGATEVFRQRQGPYEIAVGTTPPTLVVGNVHLSVRVVDGATGRPVVNGAVVTIEAWGPEGLVVGPLRVPNVAAEPWWYDANVTLEAVGTWRLQLTVESELGEERVAFSLLVQEARVNWGAVVAVLVGILLGLPVVVFIRRTLLVRRGAAPWTDAS